jgi:hypothetical protein
MNFLPPKSSFLRRNTHKFCVGASFCFAGVAAPFLYHHAYNFFQNRAALTSALEKAADEILLSGKNKTGIHCEFFPAYRLPSYSPGKLQNLPSATCVSIKDWKPARGGYEAEVSINDAQPRKMLFSHNCVFGSLNRICLNN